MKIKTNKCIVCNKKLICARDGNYFYYCEQYDHQYILSFNPKNPILIQMDDCQFTYFPDTISWKIREMGPNSITVPINIDHNFQNIKELKEYAYAFKMFK